MEDNFSIVRVLRTSTGSVSELCKLVNLNKEKHRDRSISLSENTDGKCNTMTRTGALEMRLRARVSLSIYESDFHEALD